MPRIDLCGEHSRCFAPRHRIGRLARFGLVLSAYFAPENDINVLV
jgi:hypothetical protein